MKTSLTIAVLAAAAAQAQATPLEDIAFYTPVKDVTEHAKVDLDIKDIEDFLEGNATFVDYDGAFNLYATGKNSRKDENTLRTLQGFSTGIAGKEATLNENQGEEDIKFLQEFVVAKEYYNSATYADEFVTNAFKGTGSFAGLGDIPRIELAVKGIQYQVVWMYVFREMYEPLKACLDGATGDAAKIKNWDEAAAFYAGSLVGPTGTESGYLLYTLAEKRCQSFGTCTGSARVEPVAEVNQKIMKGFIDGREAVLAGDCQGISDQINIIKKQMMIPLIQGSMLYAYKGDKAAYPDANEKAVAEGWAFAAPILPFVDQVSPTEAAFIRKNMEMTGNSTAVAMEDGFAKVFESFYKVLPGMCITCEDIGVKDFDAGDNEVPECVTDTVAIEDCDPLLVPTPDNSAVLIGLLIGCVILLIVVGGGMYMLFREDKSEEAKVEDEEKPVNTV